MREQGGDPRLVGGSSDPVEWSEAKAERKDIERQRPIERSDH